jgi:toxin YhaV
MDANGWKIYFYSKFDKQLQGLEDDVNVLALKDPVRCPDRPASKLLAAIRRLIFETIPRDPGAPEFRQGNTLGPDNRHWFRAKFNQRYRLFYRFSSKEKVIVYAWVNDEQTLRKAGSKTDPYAVFRAMLEAGDPPGTMKDLLSRSREVKR